MEIRKIRRYQRDKQWSSKHYTETNERLQNTNQTLKTRGGVGGGNGWCSGRVSSSCSTCDTHRVTLITKRWWSIKEERTGLWLQQTGHICGHLWHRYSVNKPLQLPENFWSDEFNVATRIPWLAVPLLRNSWYILHIGIRTV